MDTGELKHTMWPYLSTSGIFFSTKLHNSWNGSVPVSLLVQNAGCFLQQAGCPAHL